MNGFALRQVIKYRSCGGSDVSQRKDLAKHTLVHPLRQLIQMAVTLVMNAFGTRCLAPVRSLVDVERRDE